MTKNMLEGSAARIRAHQPNFAPYPNGGDRVTAGLTKKAAKQKTPREQLKQAQARTKRDRLVAKMLLELRCYDLLTWDGEGEHKFHSKRNWRLDIAWPEKKVSVEVHGGTYTNGRHTRGKGFANDREKMNEAQLLGWTVIEVTEAHIDSGQAIEWVKRALRVA